MTNQDDQRRLEAIEQHMFADDPEFVRQFRRRCDAVGRNGRTGSGRAGRARWQVWAAATFGLLVFVVGIVTSAPGLALVGALFLVASIWVGRVARARRDRRE